MAAESPSGRSLAVLRELQVRQRRQLAEQQALHEEQLTELADALRRELAREGAGEHDAHAQAQRAALEVREMGRRRKEWRPLGRVSVCRLSLFGVRRSIFSLRLSIICACSAIYLFVRLSVYVSLCCTCMPFHALAGIGGSVKREVGGISWERRATNAEKRA